MNSAKEKLMRLVAMEDNPSAAGSPFLSTSHLLPSHSAANFSSVATDNLPFSLSQELQPWLSNSQYVAGLLSTKRSIEDLEHTEQENVSLDITAKCKLVNKQHSAAQDEEEQRVSQSSTLVTRQRLHERRFSTPSEGASQPHFPAPKQKQSCEASSACNKTFQEILQDLSVNPIPIMQPSSRGPKDHHERRRMSQPKKPPFSVSGPTASRIQRGVNTSASRMQRMSRLIEDPCSAPRSTEEGGSLLSLELKHPLQTKPDREFEALDNQGDALLLDNPLGENCASTFYPTNLRNFQYQRKDFLARAVPGLPASRRFLLDSGSSSSGEGTYCPPRQAREACHCSLSSSSDSCMIDPDLEFSTLDCAKLYRKTQQIVNFNEDLEPTYV